MCEVCEKRECEQRCSVFMIIATQGVRLFARCFKRSEEYTHCYTWSEAICSILYKE